VAGSVSRSVGVRVGLAGEQRHLAKEVALAQRGDRLAALLHHHLPALDQVECVGGLALAHNQAATGGVGGLEQAAQGQALHRVELAKQRHARQGTLQHAPLVDKAQGRGEHRQRGQGGSQLGQGDLQQVAVALGQGAHAAEEVAKERALAAAVAVVEHTHQHLAAVFVAQAQLQRAAQHQKEEAILALLP